MKRALLIGVIALCVLAGAGWYFGIRSSDDNGAQAQAQTGGPPPGVPVEAEPVTVDAVTTEVSAVGTLRANESANIAPKVAGRVAEIMFEEGGEVSEGQPLIRMDRAVLEAELAEARASLALSQANYERANRLASQGTGTQQALDEALATLRADEARVALAEALLAEATINAPFDGRIGLRSVSVGDYVAAGQNIVNLEQIDPIKVDFRVPAIYLTEVEVGQEITINVDAIPDRTFEGRIYAIDPLIDVNGRALHIRARIPNETDLLRPGLFARVSILVDTREESVLVEESAIVPQGEQKYVYRVVDGKAVFTEVEIGQRVEGGMVEIVEGLEPDAVVVTAGQMKLQDGAPVTILDTEAQAGAETGTEAGA